MIKFTYVHPLPNRRRSKQLMYLLAAAPKNQPENQTKNP